MIKLPKFRFPFPGESKILNKQSRRDFPGDFIELVDGITHYQLAGIKGAPLVVLVHGASTPNFIWDPTFRALLSVGFRVLPMIFLVVDSPIAPT